jgi:hypothetical protein
VRIGKGLIRGELLHQRFSRSLKPG